MARSFKPQASGYLDQAASEAPGTASIKPQATKKTQLYNIKNYERYIKNKKTYDQMVPDS